MQRESVEEEESEVLEPDSSAVATTEAINRRPMMVATGVLLVLMGMVTYSITSEPEEDATEQERLDTDDPRDARSGENMAERLRHEADGNQPEPELEYVEETVEYAAAEPEPTWEERLREARENVRIQRILQNEQRAYDARWAARTGSMEVTLGDLDSPGSGHSPGRPSLGSGASTDPRMAAMQQEGMAYYQARRAQLMGQGGVGGAGTIPGTGELGVAAVPPINAQREAFAETGGQVARPGVLVQRVRPQSNPFELKMGTVIPGVLETEINSDTPALIRGRVSENVYDTTTGQHLLIPQGSQLIGTYNSNVGNGQVRVQIGWTRINFPNGSTLDLEGMMGADQAGAGGFRDRVNRHVGRRVGMALLLTAFAVAYESTNQTNGLNNQQSALAAGVGENLVQMGTEAIQDEMSIPNTLTIRSGYRFHVQVDQDINFPGPYQPLRAGR